MAKIDKYYSIDTVRSRHAQAMGIITFIRASLDGTLKYPEN